MHSHTDWVVPQISACLFFFCTLHYVVSQNMAGSRINWLPERTLVSLPQPDMYTRIICMIVLLSWHVTNTYASKTSVSCGRGLIWRVVQECGHTRGDMSERRPRTKRAPASSWGNALTRLQQLCCNPVGCTHQQVTQVCQDVWEGIVTVSLVD